MTTTAPHIRLLSTRNAILLLGVAFLLAVPTPAPAVTPNLALLTRVTAVTITYTAHDGSTQRAELLLPSWYTRHRNPPLPLVISPHGRGGKGSSNAEFWGTLPTTGGFAVVNPDGMGRRLDRISFGYRGQIDDLARMPDIVAGALPWVRIDRDRIFALGSSMGGQETLLLVARHPELLAGAAAMDSVTDMTRRHGQLHLSQVSALLQSNMETEVGGTPAEVPGAYAARSPLSQAHLIARSDVPLQIWWSTKDRIVIDQRHQSGTLFRSLRRLGPCAPVKAYVGDWRHSTEMRSTSLLPLALIEFGLLPQGSMQVPATVDVLPCNTTHGDHASRV
jgi:dipeptidyl aminopeptidase/acylaminoacyl peptidase